jgi:hypothetical protein
MKTRSRTTIKVIQKSGEIYSKEVDYEDLDGNWHTIAGRKTAYVRDDKASEENQDIIYRQVRK